MQVTRTLHISVRGHAGTELSLGLAPLLVAPRALLALLFASGWLWECFLVFSVSAAESQTLSQLLFWPLAGHSNQCGKAQLTWREGTGTGQA
jgi:hypothetical protein